MNIKGSKWLRRVQPRGGSLLVVIPAPLTAAYQIKSGDYVLFAEEKGRWYLSLFEPWKQAHLRRLTPEHARSSEGPSQVPGKLHYPRPTQEPSSSLTTSVKD